MNSQRMWAVMVKEFIEIRRDPRTLALSVLMPILLLILFGFAITLDIHEIPTAICDRDQTSESRGLIESFLSSGYFRLMDPEACDREGALLDRGLARIYIEIPPDFGSRLSAGANAPIQVLLDGADNNTASVASGYVEQVLRNRTATSPPGKELLSVRSRIWYNPDLNSTEFITPGVIGMLIMIIGVALPAMAVVRERELGNMEVLISTPVRPMEMILGKMLPYAMISIGVILMILVVSVTVLHVPFRGGTVHLAWQTMIFLLATLGMGLLISTVARTRAVAYFISLLTTLLPTFILSGFIFPIESMPLPLQGVSYVIPTTHFLIILRAILLKGVGAGAVWPHTVVLIVFALIVIAISVRRFETRMK